MKTNPEHVEAAKQAHLFYVSDESPGIRRVRHGKGFIYKDPKGKTVNDFETLVRIRQLVIPPAWTDVWICPTPRAPTQPVGRADRGRKQYRHPDPRRATPDDPKYKNSLDLPKPPP